MLKVSFWFTDSILPNTRFLSEKIWPFCLFQRKPQDLGGMVGKAYFLLSFDIAWFMLQLSQNSQSWKKNNPEESSAKKAKVYENSK